MQWRNLYRGFFMGISDLIPGSGGATIANILGIYDELLTAIRGFFSRDWKKHIGFLVPLAIGIAVTLLVFSKVMNFLLKNYHAPTQYFFLGLMIGVLPFIAKQANVKKNFKWSHFLLILVVGILLAFLASMLPHSQKPITALTGGNAILLFLAGLTGSVAMLLPGISGSLLLLVLGVYSTVIGALSNFNLPIIIVIGAGMVVGLLISGKTIQYLLSHYKYATFAVMIGLVIGSLFIVYPGIPESGTPFVLSVIAFITGLIVGNLFSSSNDIPVKSK